MHLRKKLSVSFFCPLVLLLVFFSLIQKPVFSADRYFEYGMKLMDKQQYQEAAKYFDASISTKASSCTQSCYRKACCLEKLNRSTDAASAYEQVIRLAPASTEAAFARAQLNVLRAEKERLSAPPNSCPILKAEKQAAAKAVPQEAKGETRPAK